MARKDETMRAGLMAALGREGEARSFAKTIKAVGLTALRFPQKTVKAISEIQNILDADQKIIDNWTPIDKFSDIGGAFSTLDLRYWLVLAEKAGVPFIPGKPILRLTDEEASLLSGTVDLSKLTGRFEKHAQALADIIKTEFADDLNEVKVKPVDPKSIQALREKLFEAMDELPSNIMVRAVETGPSILKTLAGVGLMNGRSPEVPAHPTDDRIWFGPGWIRIGNRRMVNVLDQRTLTAHCAGDINGDHIYVARPWVEPSRWLHGVDVHTVGTPFEDPNGGKWPVEWRAFIYDGKVTAVSSYYGWAGQITQEDAKSALILKEKAQAIVDAAKSIEALPQLKQFENMRNAPLWADIINTDFPIGSINATIDFIETADITGKPDIVMLEAGPAYHPLLPGGHPCSFCGISFPEGVAFKPMDGVFMPEPSTFMFTSQQAFEIRKQAKSQRNMPDFPGLSRDNSILDWDAVENLAKNGIQEKQENQPEP